MEPLDWDQLEKVYFVGIGGIGMSALARYMNRRGKTVAGYDRVETPLTRKLVAEGMQIHYEDRIESIPFRPDLVVYTPAVPGTHQELSYLRSEGLPVLKRAAILGTDQSTQPYPGYCRDPWQNDYLQFTDLFIASGRGFLQCIFGRDRSGF
jgi:UDP-N-acetylmuramate-alanine ligase